MHAAEFLQTYLQRKNFLYLNSKNVLHSKVLETITDFFNETEDISKDLQNNLSNCKNVSQYVYSNVFAKIYCSTERRGFNLKSNFHIIFKT